MTGRYDVEGPVLAEMFLLWADGDGPHLTGPCGPAPWYIEVGAAEDPQAVALTVLTRVVGAPLLLHSTSWRRDKSGVVLSFVAVIAGPTASLESLPVGRADLARGGASHAATSIAWTQVLEHGLRHLAWLLADDVVVTTTLAATSWPAVLADYVPEPFRHLG